MIHIYSGSGKGKTTAAAGLAVRAAGAGLKVMFYQFLKNGSSSEIKILESIEGITVRPCRCCNKFTKKMTVSEKEKVKAEHNKMLKEIQDTIECADADMIVADELIGAYNNDMLNKEYALKIIKKAYDKNIEFVMTGREPPDIFCEFADYHSEIKALKHPYKNGIAARLGIEY